MKYKGFADIVERIFKGSIKPGDIDKGLLWEQFKTIFKGVEKGFGVKWADVNYNSPDGRMLEMLRENVFVFSAAKNYQELKEISSKLLDENGNVRSFESFKQEALKIHEVHNKHYLQAEYNHAVASAQMSSKWVRIKDQQKTFPFLKFNAVNDQNTTALCKSLDGVIKPVDDPFWLTYYPPNHWGCRSDADQVESGRVTPDDKIVAPQLQEMFKVNVGVQGVVFPKKHPYYKIASGDVSRLARNIELAKAEAGIFTPAKTIAEAENFALNNGLATTVRFKDLPIDHVNAVTRSLWELKRKTGLSYDSIITVGIRGKYADKVPMRNALFPATGRNHLEININYLSRFSSFDQLNQDIFKVKKSKWWQPKDYSGLVYHEFGHRLTAAAVYKLPKEIQRLKVAGVSDYGKTDLFEFLSETFTLYMQEGKAALTEEWINLFNKYSIFKI